jgi:hypothetical protein
MWDPLCLFPRKKPTLPKLPEKVVLPELVNAARSISISGVATKSNTKHLSLTKISTFDLSVCLCNSVGWNLETFSRLTRQRDVESKDEMVMVILKALHSCQLLWLLLWLHTVDATLNHEQQLQFTLHHTLWKEGTSAVSNLNLSGGQTLSSGRPLMHKVSKRKVLLLEGVASVVYSAKFKAGFETHRFCQKDTP